ncbi:Ubiquitin carboxyl-terminal hydrolase 19 [Vitis vinifera]|uniref:Ubiquitin carboxyl-terminal hydrolase 19 n=1 Tax=Vitis vinifera TaxID=29760 RepID=A0A438HIF4_VITVI|nr:Ubiquitin carboxyl-terminal hydrolase 19 [Vitis vinifera]
MVVMCSQTCQATHWKSGHKTKCKDFQLSGKANLADSTTHSGRKASGVGVNNSNGIALVPSSGTSKILKQSKEILFPYDEFVEFFNWDKPGFPPCGLINCGNSCFANVVLQCLAYTRPLVAYLLEKGHRRQCRRNDWCFLCEFQVHVERASHSPHPFSPINILSRLPSIGGNLGYGKQEDAHEFMRFAIDTMQSVCLDEFGGEKSVHPSSQETTLIQHIFGGHLQSQVICTKCSKISNQYENMMDLTVEIHGDAASLEECLDQFTVTEWLHGENMYKCDGCNDYVKASKRLTVRHAPNILTIALKRFQSGRFGKLNKRVTFPETLDLSPYMSKAVVGTDVYKLYAVVVTRVELDDVLSQGLICSYIAGKSLHPNASNIRSSIAAHFTCDPPSSFIWISVARGKSQQPDHQFDIQRENTNGLGNKSFSSESELIVTAFSYQYEPATHM